MKPFCLTIAGSDPTSGAGIQADIRTFDRIGVHPFSVITAITFQSAIEFYGYKSLSNTLNKQFEAIFSNYSIKYVKIGMIPDIHTLESIIAIIKNYDLIAVLDPVSIASVGERLSSEGLELEIERDLFPLVSVLTPNLKEAEYYSNRDLSNKTLLNLNELKEAALILVKKMYNTNTSKESDKCVIIKSAGTFESGVFDLACFYGGGFSEDGFYEIYQKPKIEFKGNVHGTGCVFSSAIAAFLAKGNSIKLSIDYAENFFNENFLNFINLSDSGKIIDLTSNEAEIIIINQIKLIYNFISRDSRFSRLIPEVRMNISGALPEARSKNDVAGIEGRITIINGYPKKIGDIKFGVSDHTARLVLTAKQFDKSINFVMNLKYKSEFIEKIQNYTDLELAEISRETQPIKVRNKEFSTMQWLINKNYNKTGKIPDIIWDKGFIGKEPMIRLFGKNSEEIILKLKKIIKSIF